MTRKSGPLLKLGGIASALVAFALVASIYGAHVATATSATVGAGNAANETVFAPNVVTISSGDSVTFTWISGVHDARNAATDESYLPLSTGAASHATTFTTPGTYYFYCSVHATPADATDANIAAGTKMVGKVVVAAASTPTTAAQPTTTPTASATTATPTVTTTPTVPTPPNTVLMPADYFSPAMLVVKPGDTVTWQNHDADLHTVSTVPGNAPAPVNLVVKPGESASFTFTTPGLYWYYCTAHATYDNVTGQVSALPSVDNPSEPMEGVILVLAPATAPTTANVDIPGGDRFSPFATTVQAGAVVTFTNHDADDHTITSVPGNAPQTFNLLVKAGGSATFTFTTPGLYWYYCDVHAALDKVTGGVMADADADAPSEPMMGVVAVLPAAPRSTATPVTTATAAPTVAPRPPSTGNGLDTPRDGMGWLWLLAGVSFAAIVAVGVGLAGYGYRQDGRP